MTSWRIVDVSGRTFSRSAIILACTLGVCGCSSALVSRAFVDDGTGWSTEVAGRAQRVVGKDVDIYVKTSNRISPIDDETARDYFGVSLFFNPKTDGLRFVPANISLTLADFPSVKPSRIDVKYAGNNSALDIWDCGPYKSGGFGPGPQYVVRRGFCVDLYFYGVVPPSPDTEFVMRIGELVAEGRRITVPALNFRKGYIWTSPFFTR